MEKKTRKLIGGSLTVLGLVVSLASAIVDKKERKELIKTEVTKEVTRQITALNQNNNGN